MQHALRVQHPDEPSRLLPLSSSEPTLIGRSSICTIMLPGSELAPVHALLVPTDSGESFSIVDTWSHLGIAIGGRRVARTNIRRGDTFKLGA